MSGSPRATPARSCSSSSDTRLLCAGAGPPVRCRMELRRRKAFLQSRGVSASRCGAVVQLVVFDEGEGEGGVEGHDPVVLDIVVLLGDPSGELAEVLEARLDECRIGGESEFDYLHSVDGVVQVLR